MRSPCLDCPPEKRNYKSGECVFCKKRMDFVMAMGDESASLPIELTHLGGARPGKEGVLKNISESEKDQHQIKDLNKNPDAIKEFIDDVCDLENVNTADVLSKSRKQNLVRIRKHLIAMIKHRFNVDSCVISDHLGISKSYVTMVLSEINKAKGSIFTHPEHSEANGRNKNTSRTSEANETRSQPKNESDSNKITIDFTDHQMIFSNVKKTAEEEFRPIPNQILYWLKKYLEVRDAQTGPS